MTDRFLVFVDDMLVAGAVSVAGASSNDLVGDGLALTTGRGLQLGLRRAALSAVAEAVGPGGLAPPAWPDVAGSMIGPLAADSPQLPGIEVLEGVNALLVDGEMIDRARFAGVAGLTVVENIEVPLPDAPAQEAGIAADDFDHLDQIGLASGDPGGDGILIGVLDTGIDASHTEFAGKTIHFAEFDRHGDLVSNTPRDAGDHGTHVASLAAGRRAGAAPDADLAVAAVLTYLNAAGQRVGYLDQIIKGFNWLVATAFRDDEDGVDVVNASLGGTGFNAYLQPAVRSAFGLGVPLVAAIGNAGRDGHGRHGSPGNYPEVLGVGACDSRDVVADFSDWGDTAPPIGPNYAVPALCAPGVRIRAAVPGGAYARKSGTSMATPLVTGVAARRMAQNPALVGNPAALFLDLRSRLAPCRPHNLGNKGGAGRIVA